MRQARIQRVSRAVGSIHVLVSRTSGVEEVEVERRRCIPLVAFPLGVGRSVVLVLCQYPWVRGM